MKRCVFCGAPPQNKTKEHVIPKWLIELTGKPTRIANFGMSYKTGSMRNFSWNSFTAPACDGCNNEFATLEGEVRPIIEALNEGNSIACGDANILLDWLDKVRTGLWLNMQMLDSNFLQIEPNFYIKDRIGKADRMAAIYKFDDHHDSCRIGGLQDLFFQYNPSCFSIGINQIHIINLSTDFYFSKQIGFPYSRRVKHIGVEGKLAALHSDFRCTARLAKNLKHPLDHHPDMLFVQACIRPETLVDGEIITNRKAAKNHVRDHTLIRDNGIKSSIFQITHNEIIQHKDIRSLIAFDPDFRQYPATLGQIEAQKYKISRDLFVRNAPDMNLSKTPWRESSLLTDRVINSLEMAHLQQLSI